MTVRNSHQIVTTTNSC